MKRYRSELIMQATGTNDLKHEDGNTNDIISVILEADTKAAPFTKKFAPTLKGATLFETCRNVWEFVKTEIPYKIDPLGIQWIKSPGRLWSDKEGDCKSFSLFIGSCLRNLGIPYGYRFASYRHQDPTPTHVYVFVPLPNGVEIILDAVWSGPFNTQKSFAHKIDKLMAKISYLGSTKETNGRIAGTLIGLPKDYHDMSDAEFDLYLARQRAEIEKENHAAVGSPYTSRFDQALDTINFAISNVDNPDAIIGMADEMIGKAAAKGKKNKGAGLLKKVGQGLKKAAKAVTKVVTAPVRLAAKGALEIYLPAAAPFFLYLFTPKDAKLPDLMARKKAKQEKLKNFIVKGIGMKESHVMAILRNSLTKRLKKSPEAYLQERLAKRVSGIAGNNKEYYRQIGIGKVKAIKKAGRANVKNSTAGKPTGAPTTVNKLTTLPSVNPTSDKKIKEGLFKKLSKPNSNTSLTDVAKSAGQGDLIGTVMKAVSWLIEKVGSLFKGEKMDPISAADAPDIERDASDAFEWKDMEQDYSNLNENEKNQTKTVATEIIETVANLPAVQRTAEAIREKVQEKLPFLNKDQVEEVVDEIEEGPEALTENEGKNLGMQIKLGGRALTPEETAAKGGGTGGFCNC